MHMALRDILDMIFSVIKTAQPVDILDILVLSYVVYLGMKLIRETRAGQLIKGIFLLLLVYIIASWINMKAISYLLSETLNIGLIALIILFQPELRRMLDHLGSVKLTSIFGVNKPVQQEMDAVITQTVRACEAMGREKVGALIVFAREQRLEEYFKTGTQIDGQVSEQLIRNIFFKNSPLHDGAMIIRDGRVAAAGCVLPLSDSNRLSSDLGTRHRAGVGMSEASDAVVVIVSEETGTISVAVGGMLKRHLAPQTLDKLLHNELCPANDGDEKQDLSLRLKQKLQPRRKETDDNEK